MKKETPEANRSASKEELSESQELVKHFEEIGSGDFPIQIGNLISRLENLKHSVELANFTPYKVEKLREELVSMKIDVENMIDFINPYVKKAQEK